jgi:hypothetical protein
MEDQDRGLGGTGRQAHETDVTDSRPASRGRDTTGAAGRQSGCGGSSSKEKGGSAAEATDPSLGEETSETAYPPLGSRPTPVCQGDSAASEDAGDPMKSFSDMRHQPE